MKIIISGGGSGGHIFPAIAIADELKKMNPDIELLFVGAKGKIEMEKVPKAGYTIKGLWISGFHRKLTLRNLTFPLKVLHSLWKSFWILKRFKPDVVVGVGGFASGPILKMAAWLNIPALIQEQNSYAGITNKILGGGVQKICVAYDKMEKYFPADKLVMTGNPVRKDIINMNVSKEAGIKHFGLDPEKKTIVMIGGSLGASSFNRGMRDSFEILKSNPEVQIYWQTGKLYFEEYKNCETAQLPNVKISAFIDRMDLAFAMADLLITRAGASTIAELCIAGKAVVLIPSPNVAEDHQTYNAKALVEKDAAVLVKDSEIKEKMIKTAIELMNNESQLKNLEQNILKLAEPNAANNIAKQVLMLVQ